jgi:hypothetical protein
MQYPMAVGAKRYALLLCFLYRFRNVRSLHRQVVDGSFTFFDYMMKVNDRRVLLSTMATPLL